MDPFDLETFLARIGLDRSSITLDLAGLALVQHSVLAAVPLHDLYVSDGSHPGVDASDMARHAQAGRGNWRFGANATLAVVLRAIGFDVAVSGAALLLDGPNQRIDHIVLDVSAADLDPHLVDVGLQRSPVQPVRLNAAEVQTLGDTAYLLLPSPQGTTLAEIDDGTPVALLRFRRVSHPFEDFATTISTERARHRERPDSGPTITRLLGVTTFDRVVLTAHHVELHRHDGVTVREHDDLESAMSEWFPTLATAT